MKEQLAKIKEYEPIDERTEYADFRKSVIG